MSKENVSYNDDELDDEGDNHSIGEIDLDEQCIDDRFNDGRDAGAKSAKAQIKNALNQVHSSKDLVSYQESGAVMDDMEYAHDVKVAGDAAGNAAEGSVESLED